MVEMTLSIAGQSRRQLSGKMQKVLNFRIHPEIFFRRQQTVGYFVPAIIILRVDRNHRSQFTILILLVSCSTRELSLPIFVQTFLDRGW